MLTIQETLKAQTRTAQADGWTPRYTTRHKGNDTRNHVIKHIIAYVPYDGPKRNLFRRFFSQVDCQWVVFS
jgi:hypothetical protein